MRAEGFGNSSTYTTSYTSTVTSPLAGSATNVAVGLSSEVVTSQNQVQSVTREPLGLGGKR